MDTVALERFSPLAWKATVHPPRVVEEISMQRDLPGLLSTPMTPYFLSHLSHCS